MPLPRAPCFLLNSFQVEFSHGHFQETGFRARKTQHSQWLGEGSPISTPGENAHVAPSVWPALCETLMEATRREEAEEEAQGWLSQGQEVAGEVCVPESTAHTVYVQGRIDDTVSEDNCTSWPR